MVAGLTPAAARDRLPRSNHQRLPTPTVLGFLR